MSRSHWNSSAANCCVRSFYAVPSPAAASLRRKFFSCFAIAASDSQDFLTPGVKKAPSTSSSPSPSALSSPSTLSSCATSSMLLFYFLLTEDFLFFIDAAALAFHLPLAIAHQLHFYFEAAGSGSTSILELVELLLEEEEDDEEEDAPPCAFPATLHFHAPVPAPAFGPPSFSARAPVHTHDRRSQISAALPSPSTRW